jgi:hypothetical protein
LRVGVSELDWGGGRPPPRGLAARLLPAGLLSLGACGTPRQARNGSAAPAARLDEAASPLAAPSPWSCGPDLKRIEISILFSCVTGGRQRLEVEALVMRSCMPSHRVSQR